MKVLIISGSHPRHLYLLQDIVKRGYDCSAIIMEREGLLPEPPKSIGGKEKNLFLDHFSDRYEIENKAYGNLTEAVFGDINKYYCSPKDLNSENTASFVKQVKADFAIIFGPDLIKNPVFDLLPKEKLNVHLGLSPWYRGSATLFWPFYFLEPQYAGATFHNITKEADAGGILHQVVPVLEKGDGIHDVGVKTVIAARIALKELLKKREKEGYWNFKEQKQSGKLFLTSDFQPCHLKVIYSLFQNKIVDRYLDGEFSKKYPKIITGI
mgnify:CR=1 FL=1